MMTNETLGLLILISGGAALVALAKSQTKESNLVLTVKKNQDGTCTFTFDNGDQITGVCSESIL